MINNTEPFYIYRAKVTEVYDGDTVTVDIDLGFSVILRKQKIRLCGINAPEVKGESRELGLVTRDWLREHILGKDIILHTIRDRSEKYGRYLGIIYLPEIGTNINEELLQLGLAIPYIE